MDVGSIPSIDYQRIPNLKVVPDLSPDIIRTYLTEHIAFSLGETNLEGLRLFYALARELGLTDQPQAPGIRLLNGVERHC